VGHGRTRVRLGRVLHRGAWVMMWVQVCAFTTLVVWAVACVIIVCVP
jgi:hypothetical protein